MRLACCVILMVTLSACASAMGGSRTATGEVRTASTTASQETREGFSGAASAPLEDLNVRREPIPPELATITYPYLTPTHPACPGIAREIALLSNALGEDYDTVPDAQRSWGARGGEAIADLVLDGVRGVTTGFIPYRGMVREVTGAARHDRKRDAAFAAGAARRSYLKGLGQGLGCAPPAAPLFTTVDLRDDNPAIERPELEERRMRRWNAPSKAAAFPGRR